MTIISRGNIGHDRNHTVSMILGPVVTVDTAKLSNNNDDK